jgi:pimeloyl-ACP methyl ester carboxylesterase
MKYIALTTAALTLLTATALLALPEPVACWKADGQAQPEAGTEARTTNAIDISYKQGVTGKAFSFNGKTSVIQAAFEWKSPSPNATWSVWIRPSKSIGQMEILSNDPFTNSLYIRNGRIAIYNAGRNLEFGPVKWGVWQHVAVVFAADHVTVYDRGGPSRQAFPLRGGFSQQRLLIGGSVLGATSAYSGLIDQVAIYDRELTQAEITELSARPKESGRDETAKPDTTTPENSPAKPAQEWTNTDGKTITAEFVRLDGDAVVVKAGGKEFRIPFAKLAEVSIRQAKALAAPVQAEALPVAIPAAPITLQIKVASKVAKVDRWGTGDRALVFFGHTGPMNESIVAAINTYAPIFTARYSIFLLTYPNGKPFSETQKTLQAWMRGGDSKLNFAGVATDLVDGIRVQTGIKEFLLVGDSLGAGILLADYAKLSASGNVRFVLISPTEPFSPETKNLPVLKNSLLLANSKGDDFVRSPQFGKWIEDQRAAETVTGKIPPGHLILGENLTHLLLAKVLTDFSESR